MDTNLLISIVTPLYNHSRFLKERVNSILNQTFSEFEWVIIDDCSTDGSQDVIQNLASHDSRVRFVYHKENIGMAATTREAIHMTSGKYVYRAESDDVCELYFLEEMINILERHQNLGFAFCKAKHMDENGFIWGGIRQPQNDIMWTGKELFRELLNNNFIAGSNIVFDRTAAAAVGGFGISPFKTACDYHLNLRMCLKYDAYYLSKPLAYHRIHSSNLSRTAITNFDTNSLFVESYELIDDVFNAIPERYSSLKQLRKYAIRKITLRYGVSWYLKALMSKQWNIAREILRGIEKYDTKITSKLIWWLKCIWGLMHIIIYDFYLLIIKKLFSKVRNFTIR